jgi:hypothetical protein
MWALIAYLLAFFGALLFGVYADLAGVLPPWLAKVIDAYRCVLAGGFGGTLYLLRAVYLNRAVKKQWDRDWEIWYVLRPLVSALSGGVAYLFLSAGLLVLGASTKEGSTTLGFLALAFIAGLNVDRFIEKVEDLAQAAWGIKKSRASGGEGTA